ncbi:hypothetical protein N9139_02180 [Akkermansiaceae bacterium]|nr:hypothetical protein [Akkermansiaceae bacterium]
MNKAALIKGGGLLIAIWLVVWGVTTWTDGRKATAERVSEMIYDSSFDDWSQEVGSKLNSSARRDKIEDIAKVLNRLDLRQREKLHDTRAGMKLFTRLSTDEKVYFLELTLTQSMKRMMEAFDQMPEKERERLVEKSLRDLQGQGGEDITRLQDEDPEVIERIVKEGLGAYYQKASAETKMDLAPLMDAFGEVLSGFARPGMDL